MKILDLVWEYRYIILWTLVVVLYALTEWNNFKSRVNALMLTAKQMAKDEILKNGDQQAEWVVKKAYQLLPKRWTTFISEDLMRKIVKWLYSKAMDYLDDGQLNGSIKAGV